MARQKKKNLSYYLAELIILVLGISLSFILNEYRVQRSEQKLESELLIQFRENLTIDSTALSAQVQSLDIRKEAAHNLLDLEPGSVFQDSTTLDLVYLMNYGGFYPADITYQEMRGLGNSHLISNKELLTELIQLYESDYDLLAEWAGADKVFLLNDLMPYVNENLPFARGLNYSALSDAKKRELIDVLVQDKTRYLIQYSEIMKVGNKAVFENALNEVRKIIDMLNEELGD